MFCLTCSFKSHLLLSYLILFSIFKKLEILHKHPDSLGLLKYPKFCPPWPLEAVVLKIVGSELAAAVSPGDLLEIQILGAGTQIC